MRSTAGIWAVVPIKETKTAKQRLATIFPQSFRSRLALAMFEDTLRAVSAVPGLEGIIVVTIDHAVTDIALQFGAQVWSEDAREGHTAAVTAAARRIGADGATLLTMPGDIPLVSVSEIQELVGMHGKARAFTIVPARDKKGSNSILCSPADAVPLRFGSNSFYPHLLAAQQTGIEPRVVEIPSIALDIDEPDDVAEFMRIPSNTLTRRLLDEVFATMAAAGGRAQ